MDKSTLFGQSGMFISVLLGAMPLMAGIKDNATVDGVL